LGEVVPEFGQTVAAAVLASLPDSVVLIDQLGNVMHANATAERVIGAAAQGIVGTSVLELVHPDDRRLAARSLTSMGSKEIGTPIDVRVAVSGGGWRHLEMTIVNLLDDPVVAGFVMTCHDFGDRMAAEATVVDSQRQLAEAQHLARLGSWEWDLASDAITWSPQLIELFDLDATTYPRDFDGILDAVHPGDRDEVDAIVRASVETHLPFEVDFRVVTRDGGTRWLHGRGTVILEDDVPVRMIGTCIDVTERLELQKELRALALIDELTGLDNRRGFLITAEQELRLARRLGLCAAIVYVDLDNLKEINDAHGHHEGDRALREIADLLSATFRESDIKARLGGDELAVFLIDADRSSAHHSVERLRGALEDLNGSNLYPFELSVSIGVVVTDSTPTIAEMLSEADHAMYADKQAGRRRPRLLVVEDDASLRHLLDVHLGETFDVTCVGDLDHALRALSQAWADIVLLDRNLPDSQGPDTLDGLREAAGRARVVVMTAEGSDPEADSLRSGADDFIAKPFDLDVLDARLARLVSHATRATPPSAGASSPSEDRTLDG
jgi:diguanylate cyclase (GGDEF)-like protein/PAS domain S-box-containing protein